MKIHRFIIVWTLLTSNLLAQPTVEWHHLIGGGGQDFGTSAIQTPDGGFILAGSTFSSTFPFSNGFQELILIKVNKNGISEWQRAYGGSNLDFQPQVFQTNDGGCLLSGITRSIDGDAIGAHGDLDIWMVKVDSTGAIEWQRAIGGSMQDAVPANGIKQTSEGSYYIAGYTYSNNGDITLNHGKSDLLIVKMNKTGQIEWKKTLGGSNIEQSSSIAITNDGGCIVAGISNSNDGNVPGNKGGQDIWILRLSDNGNILWQKTLGGSSDDSDPIVTPTNDGGFILASQTASNNFDVSGNHGGTDFWVIKFNSEGQILWQKVLGGSNFEEGAEIIQLLDGAYLLTGYTKSTNGDVIGNHGGTDTWVVKLAENGDILWQKPLGGLQSDQLYARLQGWDGGLIFSGYSKSATGDVPLNQGAADMWITKLSLDGSLIWSKTLGGGKEEDGRFILQSEDGGYLVLGTSYSTNGDLAGLQIGNGDLWVVKLAPDFVHVQDQNTLPHATKLEIFPNPAEDIIQLRLNTDTPVKEVQILDFFGRIVFRKPLSEAGSISISELPAGMYLATVRDASGRAFSQKLAVQR